MYRPSYLRSPVRAVPRAAYSLGMWRCSWRGAVPIWRCKYRIVKSSAVTVAAGSPCTVCELVTLSLAQEVTGQTADGIYLAGPRLTASNCRHRSTAAERFRS